MRVFILLIVPIFIFANNLKELIFYAKANNEMVKASSLNIEGAFMEVESKRKAFYPTIDVGGAFLNTTPKNALSIGSTVSLFAKVGVDLYDGGKKSYLVKQKLYELKSKTYDKNGFIKMLIFLISQDFYDIKSLKSNLKSIKNKRIALDAQLQRVKKFYKAGVATKDNIDKLQSAYDTNEYQIEAIKFQIISLKKDLELKTGKKIEVLDESKIIEPNDFFYKINDEIKSLIAISNSLKNLATSIGLAYAPTVRVEDTINHYEFFNDDGIADNLKKNQNTIMLTVGMRIFDGNGIKHNAESIRYQMMALNSQIDYKKRELKINFEIAKKRLESVKISIKSSSSALNSAISNYESITKKFKAGIVDNIAYLDALSDKTVAEALYEKSINDYEKAKAMFYFVKGENLEEFVK